MRRRPQNARHLVLALLAAVFVLGGLTGCQSDDKQLVLATVLPATGPNAMLGDAMRRGVELAVKQSGPLGNGYTLTVTNYDEANAGDIQRAQAAASDPRLIGMIGPLDSETALTLLPALSQAGVATISPGATLPGLTRSDAATAEGVPFAKLHPRGKPIAFFRMTGTDTELGAAMATLALDPKQSQGLRAQRVFLVDDGSASGVARAAAFTEALKARRATLAGKGALNPSAPDSGPALVAAIVKAYPDAVVYAGATPVGVFLRELLSLSGLTQMRMLDASASAGNPAWSASLRPVAAAANTIAVVPAPDPTRMDGASAFVAAYEAAYPGRGVLPQSGVTYDAATIELNAVKALIKAGKDITPGAVLAAVAATSSTGVTGPIAFDANGDRKSLPPSAVYACDVNGVWRYITTLGA